MHVSGVFTPAGGDVDDINLVVMRAEDLGVATNRPTFDRVDIVADQVGRRSTSCSTASPRRCPSGTMVVPPSVVGFDEQLRAELEIQRAYHWVLNPNHDRGHGATFGHSDDPDVAAQNQQNYDENYWQTKNTELRVSRVAFVDSATALVTYRAYYGGMPSSVVNAPMTGVAEQHRRAMEALGCRLVRVGAGGARRSARRPVDPPPPSVAAPPRTGGTRSTRCRASPDGYHVLADRPTSTVAQRVDVVDRGDQLRDAIEAGVKADAQYAGTVSFIVSGARLVDPTHAQILYSLIADGSPRLETPYPLVGNAVLVDGMWKVASRYACGLTALGDPVVPGRRRAADHDHALRPRRRRPRRPTTTAHARLHRRPRCRRRSPSRTIPPRPPPRPDRPNDAGVSAWRRAPGCGGGGGRGSTPSSPAGSGSQYEKRR